MLILKMPERGKPSFKRYIGIDYSGAKTADDRLKGLRVYEASRESLPVEVEPPPGPRKYWTRRGVAEWLAAQLSEDVPTLAGIDHSFSFPLRYFEVHRLEPDWPTFLDDFQKHWPTDAGHTYVDWVRRGLDSRRDVIVSGQRRLGNGLPLKNNDADKACRPETSRPMRAIHGGPEAQGEASVSGLLAESRGRATIKLGRFPTTTANHTA